VGIVLTQAVARGRLVDRVQLPSFERSSPLLADLQSVSRSSDGRSGALDAIDQDDDEADGAAAAVLGPTG
jgi:hypothetical protein